MSKMPFDLSVSVKRKSEDECHYDPPKRLRRSQEMMIDDERAEQLPEGAAQFGSLLKNALGAIEPTSVAAFNTLLTLVQASSVVTPSEPRASEINDPGVQVAAVALGQLSQKGPPNRPSLTSDASPTPLVQVQNPGTSAGPSNSSTLGDMQNVFPNPDIVAFLLDHYFHGSSIHWLWPVIHQPAFDTIYLASQSGSHHPTLDFHALVAMLCACALQFFPDTDDTMHLFPDYALDRHVLKRRLHGFSRSVLVNVTNPPPSAERIQASALHALYHENEGNLEESYYFSSLAIRMAQTLGMNRDGMALIQKLQPLDAEVRRRLWWILFTLDRFQCLALRRPYIILDQHSDTATPLNLDLFELRNVPNILVNSLDHPTETTFQILQSRWARLIGGMWDQCFCTKTPVYRTVIDIEAQIRKFELDLSRSFRSQSMQGAIARPYLMLQNQIMTLQIYHVRTILLRPYLFIRSTTRSPSPKDEELGPFHTHAKTVCVIFCKRLLAFQQILQTQVPRAQLRWSSLVSRVFDSALMLALAIIMDPNDNQNEELDEWIGLAEHLVKDLGTYNIIATKGNEALASIRRRTRLALSRSADGPALTSAQYMEQATQVLAQPQPSLSELLGQGSAADPRWTNTEAGCFLNCIPGIEVLCGPVDPELTLNEFFDRCLDRQ